MQSALSDLLAEADANGSHQIRLDVGDWSTLCKDARRFAARTKCTTLRVSTGTPDRPNTLSAIHGHRAFPLHTDKAFLAEPPRYIVLANVTSFRFNRATLHLNAHDCTADFLDAWKRSVWELPSQLGTVKFSGYSIKHGKPLFRWDTDFLIPANDAAESSILYAEQLSTIAKKVTWEPMSALVLDNWSALHGRADSRTNDSSERILERLEIWL